MVKAVKAITGDASFHLLCGSDAQSGGSAACPALDNIAADSPSCQPLQQQRLWQPPDGHAGCTNQPHSTGKCHPQPLGGFNEPHHTPLSLATVSQYQWAPKEAEAGGIVCSPASWAMACHCSARDTPLNLQDAFRCLHPQARESTHTAFINAPSARTDRWSVSDSLLPDVSAPSVTDLILLDHEGVAAKLFRQLSSCLPVAKNRAQKACPMSSSPSSGRCLAQSCWQSCKMPFKISRASACQTSCVKGLSLFCKRQGLQGPVGHLPPHYPPQQRLTTPGQGSAYPLWGCPSACGGPRSDRFCAWSVDWRQCAIPRRWGTCSDQVSLAAWFVWISARHMTAWAAPGC